MRMCWASEQRQARKTIGSYLTKHEHFVLKLAEKNVPQE